MPRQKYGNTKTEVNGIVFESKREAYRYAELTLLQAAGEISDLRRQVKFVLVPAQREPDVIGPKGGRRPGKLLEHELSYIADFVYVDKDGEMVVEDTKGFRTETYICKRKLMLWVYDIRISEV